MTHDPVLCLASASPRRRDLLASIGVTVEVRPVDIDETPRPAESSADYVVRLAREKALAGARLTRLPTLGSDTAVVRDGDILGKPASREHAGLALRSWPRGAHRGRRQRPCRRADGLCDDPGLHA